MNKEHTKEYVKDIRAMLLAAGVERVYYLHSPETKTFPYVVFEVSSVSDMKRIRVDIWGRKGDETVVLDIADSLEAYCDGLIIANLYHTSNIYSNHDKQWIPDEDESIIRTNLSFDATYQS